MSFNLCQSVRRVLAVDEDSPLWSQRARTEMAEARAEYPWLQETGTNVIQGPAGLTWWTFGGDRANAAISRRLGEVVSAPLENDGLSITANIGVSVENFEEAIEEIRRAGASALHVQVDPEMLEGLKFTS